MSDIYTTDLKKVAAWSYLILMVLTLCLPPGIAFARDIVLKGRSVAYAVRETWTPMGDHARHGAGTRKLAGVSFFEDGRVGTTTAEGTYVSDIGLGAFQQIGTVSLSDGSTIMFKYEGTSKPADGNTNTFKGTVAIIEGTGQFQGIKGEGTFTGTRYGNGMQVSDWEMRASLPD